MKTKLILLSSLTAAITLSACQHSQTEHQTSSDVQKQEQSTNSEVNKNQTGKLNTSDEKQSESNLLENSTTESKDSSKSPNVNSSSPTNSTSSTDTQTTTSTHKDTSIETNSLKAEDIIVSYFNAISLGDTKTISKVFPTGAEENQQLAKLFQTTKITADIIDMKKVSLNDQNAEYTVKAKLFTKEIDDDFTNNISDYKLALNLEKGTIESKAITATNYLE